MIYCIKDYDILCEYVCIREMYTFKKIKKILKIKRMFLPLNSLTRTSVHSEAVYAHADVNVA